VIRIHLRHIEDYFIFAWIFRTSWPKMGVLCGKIAEGVVGYWPQWTHFSFWRFFLRLCQFWRKSIKKCDRESAHRWTETLTHWQTQTDFIICLMLYAIAIEQMTMGAKLVWRSESRSPDPQWGGSKGTAPGNLLSVWSPYKVQEVSSNLTLNFAWYMQLCGFTQKNS